MLGLNILLNTTLNGLSLSEIAIYVHFPNQSYFTKIFKKVMGTTPMTYRSQNSASEIANSDPLPTGKLQATPKNEYT